MGIFGKKAWRFKMAPTVIIQKAPPPPPPTKGRGSKMLLIEQHGDLNKFLSDGASAAKTDSGEMDSAANVVKCY